MAKFNPPSQIDVPASQELDLGGVAPAGSVLTKKVDGTIALVDDGDLKGNSLAAQAGLSGGSVTGGALIATEGENTVQIEADGVVTLNATERLLAMIPGVEIVKNSTGLLTADECMGTVINNTGQTGVVTLTLPTAVANLRFLVQIGTPGFAFHLKAGTNDKIYLDGTALDNADKVSNSNPAIGHAAVFWTFLNDNGFDWLCNTQFGVWIDGGA